MTTTVPQGWQYDPEDPHLLRWHDGERFTDERKPRMVMAAEDQVRLLSEIRGEVAAVRSLVMVLVVVTLLAGLGSVAVALATHA